ncbi:MAG: FAD:protein FMN transferase [Actinomycetota bacterium]
MADAPVVSGAVDAPDSHAGARVAERGGWAMHEFTAMASPCRIVSDDDELVDIGVDTVRSFEARWSRFVPDSEVSAINRRAGEWCLVEPDTFRLFHAASVSFDRTGGRFDPLLGTRLDEFRAGDDERPLVSEPASPWDRSWPGQRRRLDVLPEVGAVLVPAGSSFDPGGIGKGLIGDIVVERLVAAGAQTVQVELGGDVRLHGRRWSGGDWPVGVVEPIRRQGQVATIDVSHGAIATSSAASTWTVDGRAAHHLIDPATGLPAQTDLASVSVVGTELWWAEVVAKVAVMAGANGARELLDRHALAGVLVHVDGFVEAVNGVGS